MEIDMKVVLNNLLNMEEEFKNSQVEIFIKVNITKVDQMDTDNTFGTMEAIIKENLKMVNEMVKEFGKSLKAKVINMKVIIRKIKKMAMEFFAGLMEIFLKETI